MPYVPGQVLLTPASLATIQQAAVLAPLHNPPGLQGIEAATEVFAGVPQVCACMHMRCSTRLSERLGRGCGFQPNKPYPLGGL